MVQTRIIMGMPITVDIVDAQNDEIFQSVFDLFTAVDNKFSTYKTASEVAHINRGELEVEQYSADMKEIVYLANQTNYQTEGFFDIYHDGKMDPSGIVKGWAILKASNLIKDAGFENFYVDAGADIQVSGKNSEGELWKVGIRNPLNPREIVKVIRLTGKGVATSGIYERGKHIYNPKNNSFETDLASITVIGPNILEADRFATASFAMGRMGIEFIEAQQDLEGYMIDRNGLATYTSGFERYIA